MPTLMVRHAFVHSTWLHPPPHCCASEAGCRSLFSEGGALHWSSQKPYVHMFLRNERTGAVMRLMTCVRARYLVRALDGSAQRSPPGSAAYIAHERHVVSSTCNTCIRS